MPPGTTIHSPRIIDARWWCHAFAGAFGAYGLLGGTLSFVGWVVNIEPMADWAGNGIAIQPNAAVCVSLAGLGVIALVLRRQRIAAVCGVIVALIGAATLLEWITPFRFGIDSLLLFGRSWGQVGVLIPGQMGPPGSLSWTLIGAALALSAGRPRVVRATPVLGVATTAISMLSLVGYLYGADMLFALPKLTVIAIQTASFILATSLGLILQDPRSEPMRTILGRGAAGTLARRALPLVIVSSIVAGMLRVAGQRARLFDTGLGTALLVLALLGLLMMLIWWALRIVDRHEQALLEAKNAAERANLAKDKFLAVLSHELRTPLTPVLATLSSWETLRVFPSDLVEDLAIIRRNVELEARLIDDLLDLTRIAKGKFILNVEVLDVQEVLESVMGMYSDEIDAKKITLVFRPEARARSVRADSGRLQQVLWNVLRNAVKFTPEGGRIEITIGNEGNDRVQITVSDSGVGISPEMRQRLFRPFEQESGLYGGLGLGLAITKMLLEAQQGTIEAQSDGAGKGAKFIITLPCVEVDSQASQGPTDSAEPSPAAEYVKAPAARILLVEDHSDTASVMVRLLRAQGYEVALAKTVAEAIRVLQGGSIDILLSDIGLPDGTGIDLIHYVRGDLGLNLPAIALTGFGMEEDVVRTREAGFNEHLTKPVNFARLKDALRQARLGLPSTSPVSSKN